MKKYYLAKANAPKVCRVIVVTVDILYKGKPVARRGRKASGLEKDSGAAMAKLHVVKRCVP